MLSGPAQIQSDAFRRCAIAHEQTGPSDPKQPLVFSYLELRKAVGWIGLLLPGILFLGGKALPPHIGLQSSISAYYYTKMGPVFIGLLCAIGVFHLATEGYDLVDRIAGRLACVFALGVAWFPTTPASPCPPCHIAKVIGHVHVACATSLFLILSVFCLFQFTQSDLPKEKRTPRKNARNVIYRICGCTILLAMLLALIFGFSKGCGDKSTALFWCETLALVAFGFAFMVKGEAFLGDHPHPRAYVEGGQ